MNFRLLTPATEDLARIAHYYDRQYSGLGREFLDEFDAVMSKVCIFPSAWKQIGARHRRCLFSRFPYAVLYTTSLESIVVSGVMDLRSDPERFLERIRRT